jgi:hypothetical protein
MKPISPFYYPKLGPFIKMPLSNPNESYSVLLTHPVAIRLCTGVPTPPYSIRLRHRRCAVGGMSRLAAATLRRGFAASRDLYSSRMSSFAPAYPRLFSADASGEASAASSTAADSQDDSFLKASNEGNSGTLVVVVSFPRVLSVYLFVGLRFNKVLVLP